MDFHHFFDWQKLPIHIIVFVMLTYDLNSFSVVFEDKGSIKLPSLVRLDVELGPETLFGIKDGFTRACFTGGNVSEIFIDFEKGTQGCRNVLKPEDFHGEFTCPEAKSKDEKDVFKEYKIEMVGNVLSLSLDCENNKDFGILLYLARYLAPASLSLELWESVFVKRISGVCGDRPFKLRLPTYGNLMSVIRPGDVAKRIDYAFGNLHALRLIQNPRLKAALHYYHVACRLTAVGETVWEFVPEIVLNYVKILEVLFGDNRENVRMQLEALGYDADKIETSFIPILLLRSHFDIAHARLSSPQKIDVPDVSKFILNVEVQIGDLIRKVIQKSKSGEFELLPADSNSEYSDAEQKAWDEINENIKRGFFGKEQTPNV